MSFVIRERLPLRRERRGFLVEVRLFDTVTASKQRMPWGFVRLERASPIMDVRGIDGYIVHFLGISPPDHKRIPIQIKSAAEERCDQYIDRNGMKIPILSFNLRTKEHVLIDMVRSLLGRHSLIVYDYESRLRAIEKQPATPNEQIVIGLIEQSRMEFSGGAHLELT